MRLLFEYHPVLGYRYVPGIRARVLHESGGYLVETNRTGFRCAHEFTPAKEPGSFRVLLFGDSFTAGDGVSDRFRFGERLEALMPGVEVFNFGLPGSGTDQQYLAWREYGRQLDADLVVAATNVDHTKRVLGRWRRWTLQDGASVALAKPYFARDPGGLCLRHVPVPREVRDVADVAAGELIAAERPSHGPAAAWTDYDTSDQPGWSLLSAILARWAGETGIPFALFVLPTHLHVGGRLSAEAYRARFAELGAALHVPMVDALATVEARVPDPIRRRAWWFRHDHHPTRWAHELMADSLADLIEPLVRSR